LERLFPLLDSLEQPPDLKMGGQLARPQSSRGESIWAKCEGFRSVEPGPGSAISLKSTMPVAEVGFRDRIQQTRFWKVIQRLRIHK
jgi:hypothetical protein